MTSRQAHSQNFLNQQPNNNQVKGYESVIGANLVVNGDLQSSGNVRIDGTVNSDVTVSGNLLIGDTGHVTGTVSAPNIDIAGVVTGDIRGNAVRILKTGKVVGDIYSAELATESGARIQGQIIMEDVKEVEPVESPAGKTIFASPVLTHEPPVSTVSNAVRAKDKKS